MNRTILLALTLMFSSTIARGQEATKVAPATKPPAQAPDVAAPKFGPDGKPNAGFLAAHEKFVGIAKEGKAELIFLGDSITNGWSRQTELWEKSFGKYKPANFGIGGDRTQHVLWRIENGELEGIHPKAVVLMIGTNNSGRIRRKELLKESKRSSKRFAKNNRKPRFFCWRSFLAVRRSRTMRDEKRYGWSTR